jgi:hypothetical protein
MTTEEIKRRIREYVKGQGFVELTIVDENDKVREEKFTNADEAIDAFEFESIDNTVYV